MRLRLQPLPSLLSVSPDGWGGQDPRQSSVITFSSSLVFCLCVSQSVARLPGEPKDTSFPQV